MLKAYRYRIYPTENQRQQIEQTFGCCRLVYNLALGIKIDAYRNHGVNLSAIDLCYQLADAKQDWDFLRAVDSQALQASIKKIDIAYKSFFNGGGFPKFKRKSGKQSFQCPNNKREVDFDNSFLTIPKIANIPIALSRKFSGTIKTVTISRVPSGKYFASILVDTMVEKPKKLPLKKVVGIDLGLKVFATLSDGSSIANPRFLREDMARLKVLQRRVSRKKKCSANRRKAQSRLAIHHERIANKRSDFLHKASDLITKNFDVVCMEDLGVKNMSKRAKKKLNEQGVAQPNGQSAKSGLNKSILDAGWADFARMLEYKSDWRGKNFVKIGRFEPSSKACNECGAINQNLTLKVREWTCETCGQQHDRDENAAKNIAKIGIKILKEKAGRGTPSGPVELRTKVRSKKQEYKKSNLI